MALDSDIVELAFSIPVWRQKSQLFIFCSMSYWTLEQILLHQIIVPRVTRNIADIFATLLLREGIEPNPGPIPISDPEQRLSERLQRILQGSNARAESPSFASFRKCLAEASRDAQMTRTPGDGMNTPPPEPKPPHCGSRSTKTRNSRGDCGTGPDGVYTETVKDVNPRTANDASTRSEFISSRSATISNCGQVSDKVDRSDSDSVTPSVSGSSMDISYIMAQARAESRVAANNDDDFYCNISASEEDVNNPKWISSKDRAKPTRSMWNGERQIADDVVTRSVNNEEEMTDDFVTRSVNDEMSEEREISYFPTPSMSRSSLDVDNIPESRTTANINDDFYSNDWDSGGEEMRCAGRRTTSLQGKVEMDREQRDSPPRPLSESSSNIEDICAQAGLESRTAFNMDDDFFTNSECSDVDEETRKSFNPSSNCCRSNGEINIRTAVTKVHYGNTQLADRPTDKATVIEDVSRRPDDNNNSNFEQHTGRKDTTSVLECLQTRSLTVAKFRAMFNRTCILLPDTDISQVDEDLQIEQGEVNRATSKATTDRFNNKERKRQHQLQTFRKKVDEMNHKASLLLDTKIQRNNDMIDETDQKKETAEVPWVEQRLQESSVVEETDPCLKSAQLREPKSGYKLTPHVPAGPKPSFVRKGRKYKQMSVQKQMKLKSKIEKNEILIPKAPTEKNHSDFRDVKKGRRIHK